MVLDAAMTLLRTPSTSYQWSVAGIAQRLRPTARSANRKGRSGPQRRHADRRVAVRGCSKRVPCANGTSQRTEYATVPEHWIPTNIGPIVIG